MKSANQLTTILLTIYLAVLCWILLFKLGVQFSYMDQRSTNLVPFSGKPDRMEMILNVVIFIPLGLYAGTLFTRWTWIKKLCFIFGISLLVETIQYIFRIGAFDSTDVITNTTGGIIGLLLFAAIEKLFNNHSRTQKFINIIATSGTVLMVTLLVMLKLNLLPIRYQ